MSTTWFIAKEYLKRLEVDFREHGKKTFSLQPYEPTETKEIEVFPGKNWITLTTRLVDLSSLSENQKRDLYELILKSNAKLVEVSFGVDNRDYLMLRNAIPVTGICYDSFNATYEAHIAGIKYFQKKILESISL
jgi:pyruvate kinase